MMIWRDINELRSDVKSLLAQSNIDKTRIDNLEKDVRFLEQSVFGNNMKSQNKTSKVAFYRDKYFKHEEIFDPKEYIKQQIL